MLLTVRITHIEFKFATIVRPAGASVVPLTCPRWWWICESLDGIRCSVCSTAVND